MSTLKPYPAYKDSGVEWLGSVPSSWAIGPVRDAVTNENNKNRIGQDAFYLSLVAGRGVMPYADKGDIGNKMPEDLDRCKEVIRGDLVINSMNYGIGAYGVSNYDGVCSPVYIVLRPNASMDVRFVSRIFEARTFQRLAQSFGNGILEHRRAISWDSLKGLRLPIPSAGEQRSIADFLDRETAEIDAFVAESEKLITLLNERRAAVITQAVTKGFPSRSVGQVSRITLGKMVNSKPEGDATNLAPYLRAAHVQPNGRLIDLDEQMMHFSARELRQLSLRAGDVVVVEGGAGFGRSALVRQDLEGHGFQNSIVRLRPISCLVLGSFLDYAIQSALTLGEIESLVSTSTIPHFTAEKVARLRIEIPPFEVQESLVASVDDQTAKIDEAIETAREAIALAKERRQALISAAVTGKIDVRAAA